MKSIVLVLLIFFCKISICQLSFINYLAIHNQHQISNNYANDSICLKNNYKINFSKDDTSVYVNLVSNDTIFPFVIRDSNSDLKSLGRLYADFDSAFFWGWVYSIGGEIIGQIIPKNRLGFRKEAQKEFIYIDLNKKYLLLADPDYTGMIDTLIVYNVSQNCLEYYKLNKPLIPKSLKYIKLITYEFNKILIKNIISKNKYFCYKIKK